MARTFGCRSGPRSRTFSTEAQCVQVVNPHGSITATRRARRAGDSYRVKEKSETPTVAGVFRPYETSDTWPSSATVWV